MIFVEQLYDIVVRRPPVGVVLLMWIGRLGKRGSIGDEGLVDKGSVLCVTGVGSAVFHSVYVDMWNV